MQENLVIERPYWNPYVAGVVLGLVLLGSFLVMGWGLGSSSVLMRLGIGTAHVLAPAEIEKNAYFGQYVGPGKNVLDDWLVFEVLGVFLGGAVAAYSAGRLKVGVDKGDGITRMKRIGMAVLGGVLMGFAARLARGCTSGQALTGGAVLSLGSWIFMMCVFAGGYMLAPFLRKQWR
ncbi:MAG: hypothetical protein DIJKHBIC_03295 [Thermoanaerobaculia bacterium]|nr:hypothetical protein [Thermoanaerobaculia bacterium]